MRLSTSGTQIIGFLFIFLLSLGTDHAQEADSRLDKFFNRFLDQRFAEHPLEATELGQHRFDDRLDDLSPGALKRSIEHLRATARALPREVDYRKLSRNGQIDYEILAQDLERSIWLEENTHPFEDDARIYNRFISDSVFLLLTQWRLPRETNIANAISRIRQIPNVIAAAELNLKHPHRPALETAIRQNRGSIAFYEKDIFQLAGETAQMQSLQGASSRAAEALRKYQT